MNVGDVDEARRALLARKDEVVNLANTLHPKMVARGGGARDVEVFHHRAPEGGAPGAVERDMLVLHLLVDTREAMGANIVNGMCEGVASLVEAITGGKVFLRILSNLTDRALVRARVRIPVQNLAMKDYSGADVRDGIILANDLALADGYRAATHNKGIMNGVDAVAIATGNDFRAIEAAAHAFAARSGQYRALTRWYANDDGDLMGFLEMPMKVGTVGGSLETNPTVRLNHRVLGNPNAARLAAVMGAVGLAQNYAALRSLSTAGIQQNHMTLHARSVASAAGVPDEIFNDVVDALIESGDIKVWKAEEIARHMTRDAPGPLVDVGEPRSSACGKVILLGEHAVVYGRSALAAPIPLAIEARVVDATEGVQLLIPRWGIEQRVPPLSERPAGAAGILALLLARLELGDRAMTIEVFPNVPRAMGLGGSSALAVSVIRALDQHFRLGLAADEINDYAYECEQAAHGTPLGRRQHVGHLWHDHAVSGRACWRGSARRPPLARKSPFRRTGTRTTFALGHRIDGQGEPDRDDRRQRRQRMATQSAALRGRLRSDRGPDPRRRRCGARRRAWRTRGVDEPLPRLPERPAGVDARTRGPRRHRAPERGRGGQVDWRWRWRRDRRAVP